MKENTIPQKAEPRAHDTRETGRTLTPPVDIFETEEGLTVVADMPGVEKDAIEVRVENDTLTLKAAAKSALPVEPNYREYHVLNYFRQFLLSDTVDQEKIQAESKHGVLVIRLPKKEAAKPKQIPVTVN